MSTNAENSKPLSLAELMGIAGDLHHRSADNPLLPAPSVQLMEAVACFLKFRRNTRMALFVYLMFLAFLAGSVITAYGWYPLFLSAFCFVGFLGFLLTAYYHQASFYSLLGSDRPGGYPLLLFFTGIPLYLLVHYHLEKEMRKALSGLFRERGLAGAS